MTSLGVFVGEQGNWHFFRDIFADLQSAFDTDVFAPKTYTLPLLHGRLNRWAFTRQMRTILQRNDVSFFEWASELLLPATGLPRMRPIVTRLHSYELTVWAPRINWDRVDRVICVSDHIRRKFNDRYPAHAHKTGVVHNGVALDRFVPGPERTDTLNIGMLGWLDPRKRVYEAVLALAELHARGCRAHLHIGGSAPPDGYADSYALAIRRLVRLLGLDASVTFHDRVHEPERWLHQIDLFVSNSYWEGQQVALLEALASGCYCLSHAWDGAEEVLPPGQLFVTDREFVTKVLAWRDLPPGDKIAARRASRALACERFDLERTTQGIRDLLADAARAS